MIILIIFGENRFSKKFHLRSDNFSQRNIIKISTSIDLHRLGMQNNRVLHYRSDLIRIKMIRKKKLSFLISSFSDYFQIAFRT